MLSSLYIKNYAIIDEVSLDFGSGFNVITGETGAGKSILLGALGLILGRRADARVLYMDNLQCIVEAHFELNQEQLKRLPETEDYEGGSQIIIRREVQRSGKSRAFINDSLVRLSVLKELGAFLVEIHNQFDSLSIVNPEYQLEVVDAISDNAGILDEYSVHFQQYVLLRREIDELERQLLKSQEDLEYDKFQLSELEQLDLDEMNQDDLESEFASLNNSGEIQRVARRLQYTLTNMESSIEENLIDLAREVENISNLHASLEQVENSIRELIELVRDLSYQASNIQERFSPNEEKLTEVQDTLDQLYKLQNKHRVQTFGELIEVRNALRSRTMSRDQLSETLASKKAVLAQLRSVLEDIAKILTKRRKDSFRSISRHTEQMLGKLAMPHARLIVQHKLLEELTGHGQDAVQFYFSANKGIEPQEVSGTASGGEISRLALSVKSQIAGQILIPTLIFDEIDTGISGKVAIKVGEILTQLADKHQIISVTHSPQVAAKADKHFCVYKEDTDQRTLTRVNVVTGKQRIHEIAKMLSTDPPSKAAMTNASELLGVQYST